MDKLKKLIDVKSIVTISLTIGFLILAIKNNALQEFLSIYTVIIAFYFGTQFQKKQNEIEKLEEEKKEEKIIEE